MSASTSRTGVLWSTINGGASVVIPFAVFALFARLMAPKDLSLVMLAVAMLELLKSFGPQGLADVLVTYDTKDRRHYQTAAAVFLTTGAVLGIVHCILVLLSSYVLRAQLPPVLTIMGLKIFFDYAAIQPEAVMARKLAFRRLGSRTLWAGLISGTAAIAIAFTVSPLVGLSVYYVLQSLVVFLMTSIGTDALVMPRLDRPAAREMLHESARATGVRIAAAGNNYLDQLFLGAFVVPSALGLYNLGKRIEVVAITLTSSFGQMLFQPLFAQAAVEERHRHIARGMAAISLICGTPIAVLVVWSKLAVPLVFGAQWLPAAPVVALLGISGLARALGGVSGALFTVTGRNGLLLRLNIMATIASILVIIAFARFGVVWVAFGMMLRNAALALAQFMLTGEARGRLASLFVREVAIPLALAAVAAFGAGQGMILLLGTASGLAVFCVLGVATLAALAVTGALLYRRI